MCPMDLSRTLIRRETSRRLRRVRTLIGEDIRRLRLDANVSVAELSRATEVAAGHLWRIEAGQANPSMEVMTAVGSPLAPTSASATSRAPGRGSTIASRR